MITEYSKTNMWLGIPDGEGRWLTEQEITKLKKCFKCEFKTLDEVEYHGHLASQHSIIV